MTEFIGHRCWVRDKGMLYSPYPARGTLEAAGENEPWFGDEKSYEGHLTFHGKSGLHAYKTYEDLRTNALVKKKLDWLVKHWSCSERAGCGVTLEIGTCWLWGTVIEHGNGWRAQHAAVKSIEQIRWWPEFSPEFSIARQLPDSLTNLVRWE